MSAGLVMLGVTVMLFRGKRSALWLYAALLLATMIWGVWEVGFDFWALTPRSDILVFFDFVHNGFVLEAFGAGRWLHIMATGGSRRRVVFY